jgi:hypothetical protein
VLTVRQLPTRRQLETLVAYIDAGSIKTAARELGMTEATARQILSAFDRRTGTLNAVQAAFLLGRGRLRPTVTFSDGDDHASRNGEKQ